MQTQSCFSYKGLVLNYEFSYHRDVLGPQVWGWMDNCTLQIRQCTSQGELSLQQKLLSVQLMECVDRRLLRGLIGARTADLHIL